MENRADQVQIRARFEALSPFMDERLRRLWAANEARALGRGGVTAVATATGLARSTVGAGLRELAGGGAAAPAEVGRQRRSGGGRKALTDHDPDLMRALETLVEPTTRGDPQSPLRWTTKSTRKLAAELTCQGHPVSAATVATLLRASRYRLQATRKTTEGAAHPDRDAQFQHIAATAASFQQRGQPVVSVDAKKKELIGDFKNGGREWQPGGQPERVRVHDFPSQALGKVTPYGVFDIAANQGWVSVGTDHDTAAFAADTLGRWWAQMGAPLYPNATDLLITADGGGSNSSRGRLWKVELQRLADRTGLRLHVCHYPPGTSKWNKIEHGLFCHITQNWRGRPLVSHEVVVELIGHTTTQTGLRVQAELNRHPYPAGQTVSDAELAAVRLEPAAFHGNWNYTIIPRAHLN